MIVYDYATSGTYIKRGRSKHILINITMNYKWIQSWSNIKGRLKTRVIGFISYFRFDLDTFKILFHSYCSIRILVHKAVSNWFVVWLFWFERPLGPVGLLWDRYWFVAKACVYSGKTVSQSLCILHEEYRQNIVCSNGKYSYSLPGVLFVAEFRTVITRLRQISMDLASLQNPVDILCCVLFAVDSNSHGWVDFPGICLV